MDHETLTQALITQRLRESLRGMGAHLNVSRPMVGAKAMTLEV